MTSALVAQSTNCSSFSSEDFPVGAAPVGFLRLGGEPGGAVRGWRIVAAAPTVRTALAELFEAGALRDDRSGNEFGFLEVLVEEIEALLVGPGAFVRRLAGRGGPVPCLCGSVELRRSIDMAGPKCDCLADSAERRAAARVGRGPKPETIVGFRLLGAPELGIFELRSSSWEFHEDAGVLEGALAGGVEEVVVGLWIDRALFTTSEGIELRSCRPRMRLIH